MLAELVALYQCAHGANRFHRHGFVFHLRNLAYIVCHHSTSARIERGARGRRVWVVPSTSRSSSSRTIAPSRALVRSGSTTAEKIPSRPGAGPAGRPRCRRLGRGEDVSRRAESQHRARPESRRGCSRPQTPPRTVPGAPVPSSCERPDWVRLSGRVPYAPKGMTCKPSTRENSSTFSVSTARLWWSAVAAMIVSWAPINCPCCDSSA